MDCPDENMLVDLIAGRLGERRLAIEPHLAECRECRTVVSALAREMEPAAVATMHGVQSFVHLPGYEPSAEVPKTFVEGDRVADRYRIIRFVASGGMGEVYEAEDLELHHRVALKAIRPHIAAEPRVIERFKREIMFARRVTHPNVCRIFDVGFHTRQEGDQRGERVTFLTMELLEGATLASHLHRNGPMAPEEVLPLVEQMATALGAAHAAGVIHRDFKSANVMLVSSENGENGLRAVITDFGLARGVQSTSSDEPAASTEQRELVGTPAYMAPEQVALLDVTAAADTYALGIVIYEMLTGRLPFVGETPMLTAVKRLHEPVPSPRLHAADVPPVWERAVMRCLEREPTDRYARITDVPAALRSRELAPSPYLGRTLNNHVLRRQIDDGIAPLFVAEHVQIDRRVAVQIFPPQFDALKIQRCFADASAASALHHPHLVELLDFGPLPEGGAYLMSEWLSARSVAALLRVEKKLPLARAMHVLRGTAAALTAAHKQGLVHGGLSSSLLFLTERNEDLDFVKVRGFGLAQLSSSACDVRADVRALGALLFEMVSGQVPPIDNLEGALVALDLPAPIEEALREALHTEPARRPGSVAELMASLNVPLEKPAPVVKETAPRRDPTPAAPRVRSTPLVGYEPAPRSSPSGVTAIFIAMTLAAIAIAAIVFLRPQPAPVIVEQAPVVAPAPVAATPMPVRVSINAFPAQTQLLLDGMPIENPYTASLPHDTREHILLARAAGHIPERRIVVLDRDFAVDLMLTPTPVTASATTPAPAKKPSSHKKADTMPLITEYPH